MKEIFVVSELFHPNKTSTAYIMTEVAKYLSANHKVTVICSDIVYDDNILYDRNELNFRFNQIRTRSPKIKKNQFFSRIWGSFFTAIAFGEKVIRHVKKKDKVFAVTNPFLLVLTLAVVRSFKKFDYTLLVHDVFPENAVAAGMASPGSLLYKSLKFVYDWAYSRADCLIVLGRDMSQLVHRKVNDISKIHIVENWYDSELVVNSEVDRNEYLGRDVTGKIVIGFAGNIGRVQHLHKFLANFRKVKNDRLIVAIIGEGALKETVLNLIHSNETDNIIYLGARSRAEQSKFLNCFDIGLVTLSPGMLGLGVPSKIYNLLASGKPILYIGDKNSETDLIIREDAVGWSFTWQEGDELSVWLENLMHVDNYMNANARQLAEQKYRSDTILSKLENILVNEC